MSSSAGRRYSRRNAAERALRAMFVDGQTLALGAKFYGPPYEFCDLGIARKRITWRYNGARVSNREALVFTLNDEPVRTVAVFDADGDQFVASSLLSSVVIGKPGEELVFEPDALAWTLSGGLDHTYTQIS